MGSRARLTVDMNPDDHMFLKMASARMGVTMREFMLLSAFEKMEEMEDAWLAERARETLDRIQSGEEKVVPWDAMKKRL